MMKTSKVAELVDLVEALTGDLAEVLSRHGASMPQDKFTRCYSRVHEARMVMMRWKQTKKAKKRKRAA